MKTFPMGGVHPSENKLSCAKPIEILPLPEVVTIPLAQHIGAPAVAKVAKGDKVVTGQLIAEAGSFMSANIHAPVSGTVTAVDMVPNGQGLRQMMITIKREGDDWAEGIDRSETIVRECTLSAQEIVARIKDAGIVGMGGATFPTHVKLSIPPGKKAESLIINGVECEPYLTSDHRTMLEHGEELLVGVTILMKAIAVEKAYIGIENNKPDAIAHLRRLAQGYKGIEVVPLKVKYPQGGEKQLIVAITGREVPPPPALPIDVGAVVCNASTTYAVYQAVQKGMPLIQRVVTITGKGLREPKNLLTRMGTPVSALIHAATMVVAGVYLVARMFPLFIGYAPEVLHWTAYIGAFTALYAAVVACVQSDIKRVLAFSTISQIGFMIVSLGVCTSADPHAGGLGYMASMFHLFTHALFKALLFLGAGCIIHAVHSNEMSAMGGLRRYMPLTHVTFLVACLAIAGIWPLSGFFSKDEILTACFHIFFAMRGL